MYVYAYTHIYVCIRVHLQVLVRIPLTSIVGRQLILLINSSSWNSDALDKKWTAHLMSRHSSVFENHYSSATGMYYSLTQRCSSWSWSLNGFRSFIFPTCKSALFHLIKRSYADIQSCCKSSSSQCRKEVVFSQLYLWKCSEVMLDS